MAQGNIYKPRYSLAYLAKSKVWPYKDSYLRRFYALRARRVQRGGLFRRCVLVATSRKWTRARRFIRPFRRRAGTSTAAGSGGKTAFGRPRKRRYRDSFYLKQQLRYFHGKRKESAFRQLFQQYKTSIASRGNSFFSALESRLDMFFFRRRLLPTIYSCHQFIQHQGLYLNGVLERSPRAAVAVGDRVTVPNKAFKPLYWDLFCRVYYRRWGLFIFRRRQYTQLKKKLYSVQPRRPRALFRLLTAQYPQASAIIKFKKNLKFKKLAKFKKAFFFKIIKKDLSVSSTLKSKYSRLAFSGSATAFLSKGSKRPRRLSSAGLVTSKDSLPPIPSQLSRLFEELYSYGIQKGTNKLFPVRPLLRAFNTNRYRNLSTKTGLKRLKGRNSVIKASQSQNRYFRLRQRFFNSTIKNSVNSAKTDLFYKKLHVLQKFVYSLRLQKSLQPSVTRFRKEISQTYQKNKFSTESSNRSTSYYRPYRRSVLRRFFKKRRKKVIRRRKVLRLKTVHFYIPSYLQRDFRTLRAIKIQSPAHEDINYTFRGSRAKVHSFYSSRGF